MKSIKTILYTLLGATFLATSCQDDDHSLGSTLDKSQLQFEIKQAYDIDAGGNTIILRNTTPGTLTLWDFGSGTSTQAIDTLHFPFKGSYTVTLSVLSGGGVTAVDPVTLEVTDDNFAYVDDPLWALLTGGVNQRKEWVLDETAKFFNGPMAFYGTDNGWLLGGLPWGTMSTGCYEKGGDCWNWPPDLGFIYGNAMTQADYGVMAFDLIDGANFHATKLVEDTEETGTFTIREADKILVINGGSILRDYKPAKNGITGISDWSNYRILTLNDSTMQLGVIRDRDVDGEGPCMLSYNFLSKAWADTH
ncbi:hypothetical protein [Parachryseolinea silvisoli]|uniref:hypothetical protein n=1 Tax=Parachryseolinea silvisoli TaxID=2873601 RepID=UPI002265E120|nr:hypothetical protein [Parachryseolinea silvisoli]MCD9015670.1 hypothetical protein [Parachryseolinea silvisoli]